MWMKIVEADQSNNEKIIVIVDRMSCEINIYTIEKRKENQGILVVGVGVGVVEVVDSRIRIGRRVK
jgi:hypothetical protein